MVDSRRAYRRWFRRRASALGFSFACVTGLVGWIVLADDVPIWAKVICAATASLLVASVAFLLAQTAVCARLHALGRRREARYIRIQLRATRSIGIACAVLGASLLVVPFVFQVPGAAAGAPRSLVRSPEPSLNTLNAEPEPRSPAAQPEPPGPGDGLPAVPRSPQTAGTTGEKVHRGGAPEMRKAPAGPPQPPEEAPVPVVPLPDPSRAEQPEPFPPPGPGMLTEDPGFLRTPPPNPFPAPFKRMGVPDEEHPEAWPPVQCGLEVFLLYDGNEPRGSGMSLRLDMPVAPRDALQVTFIGALLCEEEQAFVDDGHMLEWEQVAFDYRRAVCGYTKRATLDLSVRFGFAVDYLEMHDTSFVVKESARISPHLGVDTTFWATPAYALEIRVGQSIPFNATGSSAAVTDASAAVRLDLTKSLTLRLGFRVVWLRLRDYPDRWNMAGGRDQYEDACSGPFVGGELRF